MNAATDFGLAFWGILSEAGPWLVVGFAAAGLIHAFVPRSWLQRHLGGRGGWPIVKAALIGAPIPMCSCSVIPTAATLRRGGASKGSCAAFAIAAPEVSVPAVSITWGMLGPAMAFARPIAAISGAIAAGLAISRTEPVEDPAEAVDGAPVRSCCTPTPVAVGTHPDAPKACCASVTEPSPAKSCCATEEPSARRGLLARLWGAGEYAFVTLPRDLAPWLVVGLALSAAVVLVVPDDWLGSLPGGAATQKLVMLAVGLPFYICATASTPLVAALVLKGLSPGAAIVFLLAGPATNPATMAWALKDLGVRATVIYVTTIAIFALAAGFAVDWFMPGDWVQIASLHHHHDHDRQHTAGAWGGAALGVVLGGGLLMRAASLFGRRER